MKHLIFFTIIIGLLFTIASCGFLEGIFGSCQLKVCQMNDDNPCTACEKYEVEDMCTHGSETVPFKCNEFVFSFDEISCSKLIAQLNIYASKYQGLCQEDYSQECKILEKIEELEEQNSNESCNDENIINLLFDIIMFEFFESGKGDKKLNMTLRQSDEKYSLISESSSSKKCNCNEDLYLYNNPIIQMEGVIVEAVNNSEMEGEGSLNYIIQPDGDYPNKFANSLVDTLRRYPTVNPNPGKIPLVNKPIVAFLDSGIDPGLFPNNKFHQNAANCMSSLHDPRGWNFIDDSNITHDDIGHGTLVAASFKFLLNPNQNYSILPVKVLDQCGYGTLYSTICGLYYAANSGANIINCSWGLYKDVDVLRNAVLDVSTQAIIVASAGNKSLSLIFAEHYPSEYEPVIEVAGLCQSYSNNTMNEYRFWEGSNTNVNNIAENAIGYEVMVDQLVKEGLGKSNKACDVQGTSYAAPRITAALVLEWDVNVSNTQTIFFDNLNSLNNCQDQRSYWSGQ